ncbi:transcription initiation factor TFIID subunit 3 isoform X1 [Harpegnathos saltator]|uniref:transcription initiation factor TFIID subunit 3 isoform X1 n=1 Tax=Harpegnathos saltator TaxID=610380 RepID=UPI000DBED13D|nr:transcription initiation factor TFIID subunit 3 isoform X1 [Harpegnathos saltator]XP_025157014.1 transcription initiation factor TFIID subunit 3 isoform X1 [Harpegnathos saltator]XP_025157015.1 transcription initiation factor TFIID subunit 3 isoform X1 [Harpegnathos saltator]
MSSEYSRNILKMVVASICQTVGWHSINSTPLEFMVDLMQEYLLRISKLTHQYSEILGRTEPNLDDLGLAFQYMNIDIPELAEYVKNVDSVQYPVQVPQYPVRRENHLNFLKPGSREVVTRPVHVHEHLPAMYPDTEEEYIVDKNESLTNGITDLTPSSGTSSSNSNNTSPHRLSPQGIFKRPGDPISFESPIVKRVKVVEEGRPLREISSVMMTTSGFLSPAREGKLPEARTPHQVRADSPQPSSYPMVPPELKCEKKPKKIVKKGPEDRKLDKENKKKKGAKELFKPDKIDDSKIKKLVGMKELAKLKPLKPGGGKTQSAALSQELSGSRPSTPKIASPKSAGSPKPSKVVQPKIKATEKVIDLTDSSPLVEKKEDTIDKLPSEPDKQKLNIFKKISKPREEKDKDKETVEPPHKHKDLNSRECSPALIIDENTEKQHAVHRNDIVDTAKRNEEKKTPHTPDVHVQLTDGDLVDVQSPSSDVYMFDDTDISPPGTPSSTPKTPELNVPTVLEQKRKKKEKSGKKKEPKLKSPKQCVSPKKTKNSNDVIESDVLDRPKTPQAPEPPLQKEPSLPPTLPFPFFPAFPPAPGLIPPPMFPRFPLPLGRGGPGLHPAMPNLAIPPRFPNPPVKHEDFPLSKIKSIEREKLLIPSSPVEVMSPSILNENEKADKEKVDNNKITKIFKPNKESPFMKVPERVIAPPIVSAPIAPPIMLSTPTVPATQMLPSKNSKTEKTEKNDTINSKSKEHKKEKKDKLKKKKDKKEKHKDKGEKVKEKKEKAEKREKLEKLKEKKEKKEKKKEKDANKKNTKEDKNPEAVPKITLKLGTASPRPATPDNALMKKITIKPLVKKPDEEVKREPSPELAKISALVTRPPKQKSTSKKTEEGILDGSPALPTDSFSANLTSVPPASAPRTKKSIYQKVKADPVPKKDDAKEDKENGRNMLPTTPATTVDRVGRQVWICPACGNQDDGSPMIGCDDCDAWYHWVCVGMQVPPADDEDWYCRFCIAKKQELLHDKKKKKRKKKVKVTA